MSAVDHQHLLTLDSINESVKRIEYAVRGPLVIRAVALERELREGAQKPFKEIIRANIGDCHAVGQHPITFIRQVLSCAANPSLIDKNIFPKDVVEKAKSLLDASKGSCGTYSDSAGIELVRRHCADYIADRDGIPSDWQDIVLTTGASEAVRTVLALINRSHDDPKPTGVMIPLPQYPLYTATVAEYSMFPIKYYLDEANQWSLSIDELERSYNESADKCRPRAIVVINPGNPTGAVLKRENIVKIIEFARSKKLMIIADEVYQHNIYEEGAEFNSFKKVMSDMNVKLELASLMSASKGYMGECGMRAGYCEILNLEPQVKAAYLKMLSARLCSSVIGQFALDCIVKPPKSGDESFELFDKEKKAVLASLKYRAKLAADTFNSIPNMKSNQVAGAMYAFPQLILPQKAIDAAKAAGQEPDFFYCWQLLEEYGICVVPGSGFGQLPGTYHFRTTILPQNEQLQWMMEKLKEFHLKFLEKYK